MNDSSETNVGVGVGGGLRMKSITFVLICSLHVFWYILKQSRKSNFAPAQKLKKHKTRVDQSTFRYGDTVLVILS